MGHGVHHPGGVEPDYNPGEYSPEEPGQAANRVEDDADDDVAGPVIGGQPDMNFIFGQVGDVAGQGRGVMMHRLAGKDPSHVRPPLAIVRRVRVAFFVRKLMMYTVCGDPENRSAFECESGAPCEEIFHPLGSLVSTMCQEAVIAHTDAETAGDPPQEDGDEECFPGKE